MPGPIVVMESTQKRASRQGREAACRQRDQALLHRRDRARTPRSTCPTFQWTPPAETLRHTPLFDVHKQMGAKVIPFAGWEMPVWYSSVLEEHLATRQAAGLFDVSHMGVYQIEGDEAASFLDSVVANDCGVAAAGREPLHPVPDPGGRGDRRHAHLPPGMRQVPDGGQRLQR